MTVIFQDAYPWTSTLKSHVNQILTDLDPHDQSEIYGLRPGYYSPADMLMEITAAYASDMVLDGFVAFHKSHPDAVPLPYAMGLAMRSRIPKVMDIAFFGRAGYRKQAAKAYKHLDEKRREIMAKGEIKFAQLIISQDHTAAFNRALKMGGEPVFDFGAVGLNGQSYTQMIWRL